MISRHEAEVARRFDALNGRFKATVEDDDYRLRGLLTALEPVPGRRILDLGCGKGRFARALQARGACVVGIDVAAAMLAKAGGVNRVRASARRLPFAPASFDGVIAVEVFQHIDVPGRAKAITEARRVLRPGGWFTVVDKNVAALSAMRPWLPAVAVKRVDELRGRWMYPPGGPVRERWLWPMRFRHELEASFEQVRILRLLSPAERGSWFFHHVPAARLMTLWVAQAPGGNHV